MDLFILQHLLNHLWSLFIISSQSFLQWFHWIPSSWIIFICNFSSWMIGFLRASNHSLTRKYLYDMMFLFHCYVGHFRALFSFSCEICERSMFQNFLLSSHPSICLWTCFRKSKLWFTRKYLIYHFPIWKSIFVNKSPQKNKLMLLHDESSLSLLIFVWRTSLLDMGLHMVEGMFIFITPEEMKLCN